MTHYRIYSLHPGTGRIVRAADVMAPDDAEAIRHGRALHAGKPFEVWRLARRVHMSAAGAPARDAGADASG